MKTMGGFYRKAWLFPVLALLSLPAFAGAAVMNNYCITPPFIQATIKPNLLMIIDNSASMYDLQYTNASGTACYDSTYDNTRDYVGYFSKLDSDGNITYPVYRYSYNSTTPADSKFVEEAGGVPTSGGTYRTSFLYIAMSGTMGASDRAVTTFIASGRFLNWLSASKFDTEKQVLTGGKYDTTRQFLVGESRGCVGRRFIRELPLTVWDYPASPSTNPLTFAIRGPQSQEPDFVNPGTQGGQTRIEIYEADYKDDSCATAASNWISGNYGTAQTQTGNCLDISGAGNTASGRTLAAFNHTMQTCWRLKENIKGGATTDATVWNGINTNDVTNSCEKVYTTDNIPPANLTSESDGKYVCTSAATHLSPLAPYNVNGSDTTGFIGRCWQGSASKFTGKEDCVKAELLHYCMSQEFTEVIDPSSTATTGGGIPAILMDAGIRAVGAPVGPSGSGANDKFLYAHVAATAPTGLLQKYGNSIRIGAMSFNDIGSSWEETGGRNMPGTPPSPNLDGGKIISYIGDPGRCSVTTATSCASDSVCPSGETCNLAGNHNAGLVNAVDGIAANTWTPFAEAYYNAIAYFVKDATATNNSLSTAKFTPDTTTANATAIKDPLNDDADVADTKNPILARCQSNNILMISDGGSSADLNSTMTGKVTTSTNYFRDPNTLDETGSTSGACGIYQGSAYLHDLSYFAKHRNIFTPSTACTAASCENAQTITSYVVYTGPATSSLTGVCDPKTQMQLTATNGGTSLYTASSPVQFYSALSSAFAAVVGGGASGTAASILSNSEGSGANILQAVFYPKKLFNTKICSATPSTTCTADADCPSGEKCKDSLVDWVGEMQNLWYYIDPKITNSTVREDSGYTDADRAANVDHFLDLKTDKVTRFYFDAAAGETKVERLSDIDGNGTGDVTVDTVTPDAVKSIWRAGRLLWERSAAGRTIKANVGGSLLDFSAANKTDTTLQTYLQVTGANATEKAANAETLINYVRGVDFPSDSSLRRRTVGIDGNSHVWKLGDIISSTPRLQSSVRQNSYGLTVPKGYEDKSYGDDFGRIGYTGTTTYKERGAVYVGANDGMLHAFKLGTLSIMANLDRKAKLSGTDLGKEMWAFIPQNALPYLKYLGDPNYSHLYVMDGSTTIVDASIAKLNSCSSDYWDCPKDYTSGTGNTWRTVLIGSMGLGGASRNKDDSCVDLSTTGSCVETPIDGVGYSSFYALDITDPASPQLLWEFSNAGLGFSTSGAAVVRVSALTNGEPDQTKNGRWFAVFGSGPTGPIDPVKHRFLGTSDQPLKIFVVDLATGTLVRTIDRLHDNTQLTNAFAGSMVNATIDTDRWNKNSAGFYQDDVLYFGYGAKTSSTAPVLAADDYTTNWRTGGVLRLVTGDDLNVNNWKLSKVFTNVGPVTAAIARLQDRKNHKLWLYFGTGRYYFSKDDYASGRNIYGVTEPCYTVADDLDPACTTARAFGDVTDQTNANATTNSAGWRIVLDGVDTANVLGCERTITDPVALSNGAVFFTTFRPTGDACGFGGNSYLWAVKYDTGKEAPAKALEGKALVQVSTGSFEEINLKTAFTEKNNRRIGTPLTGKPPTDAPPIVSSSDNKPVKRILHIQER